MLSSNMISWEYITVIFVFFNHCNSVWFSLYHLFFQVVQQVYGENTMWCTYVFEWHKSLEDGREEEVKDNSKSRWPSTKQNLDQPQESNATVVWQSTVDNENRQDMEKECVWKIITKDLLMFEKWWCCIQKRTTMLMYKNINYFFSCFYLTIRNVRTGWVRASQSWLKCIHRRDGEVFLWNHSVFLFCSAQVEIFPGLYDFLDTYTNLVVTRPVYALYMDAPAVKRATCATYLALLMRNTCVVFTLGNRYTSCNTTLQPMRHFHCGIILFTLGNMCTSCYATHATYAAFQGNLPVSIQQWDWVCWTYISSWARRTTSLFTWSCSM